MHHRTLLTAAALALVAPIAAAAPLSTFDTGFDGWSASTQSGLEFQGGTLERSATGGFPGGYLFANDREPGMGTLPIQAPEAFTGDLSAFAAIRFDQIAFPSNYTRGLRVDIIGAGGTRYNKLADQPDTFQIWETVTLEFSSFVKQGVGTASLADVLADVEALLVSLEVSQNSNGTEGGVDNITLVPAAIPLPAAPVLLVTGLAGLALLRRRG